MSILQYFTLLMTLWGVERISGKAAQRNGLIYEGQFLEYLHNIHNLSVCTSDQMIFSEPCMKLKLCVSLPED